MPPFISTVTCPTRRGVRPFASVFATSAEHFHFFAPTKELHQPSPFENNRFENSRFENSRFENRGIISYLRRGVNTEALRALGAGRLLASDSLPCWRKARCKTTVRHRFRGHEALRALGAGLARTVACGTPPA
jgi:hypothetical protein